MLNNHKKQYYFEFGKRKAGYPYKMNTRSNITQFF